MPQSLFTLVCEFVGGTYISQFQAADERQAIRDWASYLMVEQPMGAASTGIAACAQGDAEPPVAVTGLTGVWCWSELVEDDPVLVNIVRSAG